MSEYTLQECTLTVPDVFRDRTMNLFTLNNVGASEFTLVVSRASAGADDSLQMMARRLAEELDTSLQAVEVIHTRMTDIDGLQAVELFYSFKSGERTLFQKQRMVLTDEKHQGKKLLSFICTCTDGFDDYHARVYENIIASIRFHSLAPLAANDTQIPADSRGIFFAFDRETRELMVFSGIAALYAGINLVRAKEGEYLFFDDKGERLTLAPVGGEHASGRYALWETAGAQKQTLIPSLLLAKSVSGIPGLETTDAIEAHVSARMNRE